LKIYNANNIFRCCGYLLVNWVRAIGGEARSALRDLRLDAFYRYRKYCDGGSFVENNTNDPEDGLRFWTRRLRDRGLELAPCTVRVPLYFNIEFRGKRMEKLKWT
jgi:hypothetical protein